MVYITLKPVSDKLQSVLKWVAVVVAIYFVWAINHQKEKRSALYFAGLEAGRGPQPVVVVVIVGLSRFKG